MTIWSGVSFVVHSDDRNVELLDLFVIYEVISLLPQFEPLIGYEAYLAPVG